MMAKIFRHSRDALRMLAPGPVALVTTMYRDQPNMMTAAWMQPVSLSPMLISIAVQPSRLTHEFMTKSEHWCH
jgi:flavin reductase (DIM6/NTAB) family NADH-FMN oxidoreductase RutF